MRARSPHFLTLSGAGERQTREILDELETLAAALRQVDRRFAAKGAETHLILFGRSRDAEPYFDLLVGRPKTPGAFVVNAEGTGTMLIDGARTDAGRTVFHELVHNLFANSGTHLPLWLEEGMADFFSTAVVNRNYVRIGTRIKEHYAMLRTRSLIPLAQLFEVQSGSETGASGYFYSESYAVVDWMMRANTASFYRFLDDVDRGMPALDALRRDFGVDPGIVERNILGSQLRPPARLTLHVDGDRAVTTTESIDGDAAVIELATFLGGFEATRQDAERFLDSVLANDPHSGPAAAAKARMRAKERRYDEASKLYEQALLLMPGHTGVALSFAESLLGNAIGPFSGTVEIESDAQPRFRRARQLAVTALANGADPERANAVIGTSYLAETSFAPGIDALRRAHALQPARDDVALNLYALLIRDGDFDEADRLYTEISAAAKTPQAILAARAVFVREQLALTNRLIQQNRMADAMAVVRKLLDVTPDAGAKADLQRQLDHLREIDDANRQIVAYNEAVAAANRGEVTRALEIVDRLLETATEAAVVRDAIALRKSLEKRLRGMRRSRGAL